MEIISQNYEKILKNMIIDNFSQIINDQISLTNESNQVFNYIKILDTLDSKLCEIALNSLKTIFETIDRGYRNSFERKHKYYIKAHSKRTIMTIFGELTYRKTIYSNKYNEGSFCYIDEFLGLKKYDYFDPYIKSLVLEYAANNPYSKVASIINDIIGNRIKLDEATNYLSRQTIRNIILSATLSEKEYECIEDKENIYIMADEKYIATQNNNKQDVMIKQIVIFDGHIKKNNRTTLSNKRIFSSFDNNNFLDESLDYLYYVYNTDKIKNIFVMGDGAKWIRKLTSHFKINTTTKVTFNLDKFHYKQALHHIAQNTDIEKILNNYVLNNNKIAFKECCESLVKENPHRIETIQAKEEYILNNWNYINNLHKNDLKCPMESQISHNIADLFSSRPKGYAKKTLKKLLKLRILYKNKESIKKLYLNNYNKKDILIINEEHLNYSMFERKPDYSLDNSYIPANYHPGFYYDNTLNYNIKL